MIDEPGVPFHVALRAAIHQRGLTLERLHQRLVEIGTPVSVATLSNWQRGLTRPDNGRSAKAVTALETVLALDEGSLTAMLGGRRARGPRRPSEHDTSLWAIEQIRGELGAPADNPADAVVVNEELVVGPGVGQWELRLQARVRSRENALARWFYFYTEEDGALPTVHGSPLTRVGRVVTDESVNTIAVELLFVRPLTRGEMYPLEFTLACPSGGAVPSLHGRWVVPGCAALSMTARFEGDYRPRAAYQVTQLDQTAPIVDVAELPLLDGRATHVTLRDPEAAFHGIRWDWP